MRKPNWKKRGLLKAITEKDRTRAKELARINHRIATAPAWLKEAMQDPETRESLKHLL
jgi:hypothetical protein